MQEKHLICCGKNICEVRDETHLPYNFYEIAKQKDIKGVFTKKMLEYLEENPDVKEETMKAIEMVYLLIN